MAERNDEKNITEFQLLVYKENQLLGEAYIAASCEDYLSNDNVLSFYISSNHLKNHTIKLAEDTIVVQTLNTDDFMRSDPKEYFAPQYNRKASGKWYKLGFRETEYTVGQTIIRLTAIEDKHPGAEIVYSGIKFHVYNESRAYNWKY